MIYRDFPPGVGPLHFWTQVGAIAGSALGGLLDRPDNTSCPNQPSNEKVLFVLQRMNAQEREQFSTLLRATKPDWYSGTFTELFQKAYNVAFAIAGGSDCKVGTDAGRRLVDFWNQMANKYYGIIGESASVGSPGATTSGGDYVYVPTTQAGPGDAVTQSASTPTTEESAFAGALKDLLGAFKGTLEQVVAGGVAGARESAQAAQTAATVQTTQTALGSPLAGISMSTLVVVGLAIVALLFAFGRR